MGFNLLRKSRRPIENIPDLTEESKNIFTIRENERVRIAEELHDELGAPLLKVNMNLDLLQKKYPQLQDDVLFEELKYLQQTLFSTIRNTIFELGNTVQQDGVLNSLQTLVRKYNSPYHARINIGQFDTAIDKLSLEKQVHVFRLFQELINNSFKHASAWKIWISSFREDRNLILSYKDDGIGFNIGKSNIGMGMSTIRKRVLLLGGNVEFVSGVGCNAKIFVPYEN